MTGPTVAVIPAHDEAGAVEGVVRRAARHVDRVLVVDDGSRDDTGERARAGGATVLRLDPNRGKGAALVHGLEAARALGAGRVVTLDADGVVETGTEAMRRPAATARRITSCS